MMKVVHDVQNVSISEMADGRFLVEAEGQVSTGGWGKAALVARSGVIQSDGTLEYDFMAEPPAKGVFVTQSFEDKQAIGYFGGSGTDIDGLTQIRVHAATNSKTARFNG